MVDDSPLTAYRRRHFSVETLQGRIEIHVGEKYCAMFLGEGIGDDGAWPPEPSVLVLGIEPDAEVQLGRRFGQRAIVCGELGGLATLALCD